MNFEQQRMEAWDRYVAAQLSKTLNHVPTDQVDDYLDGVALIADHMLKQRDKRFPVPKEYPQDDSHDHICGETYIET